MRIAIFAHDAGASDLLLALQNNFQEQYTFLNFYTPNSPFDRLLRHHNKKVLQYATLTDDLTAFQADLILIGTSWQTDIHNLFLNYAKENNIPSAAFLDHWTYYEKRFKDIFPNFILTFDTHSTQLAKKANLPNVIEIQNYHLQALKKQYSTINKTSKKQLLFLSEPTAKVAFSRYNNTKYWGFDEIDIFKEILHFAKENDFELLVRLHPSDESRKYKKVESTFSISTNTLLEDIANSQLIIGIDTIALYYAYIFGKKVVALMPSSNREVVVPLPQKNIKKTLQQLDIDTLQTYDTKKEKNNGLQFDTFIQRYIV